MRFIYTLVLIAVLHCSLAQPSKSFFVVHADPLEPNGVIFSNLVSLVNKADSHNVKLTIEFSKPWCDSIIARPTYSAQVKQWQQQGHELAVHHHDYDHYEWDGYSVISTHPAHTNTNVTYKGHISALHNVSNQVCGDSLCLTVGSGPGIAESINDWKTGWIYKTDGGTNDTDAFSDVTATTFGPYNVCTLGYTYLATVSDYTSVTSSFTTSTKSVCGVVTHVWNWVSTPAIFNNWFSFISGKTPGQCKTVRQIARENGCAVSGVAQLANESKTRLFPVPVDDKLVVTSEELIASVELYDALGRMIFCKEPEKICHTLDVNMKEMRPGIYFVKIEFNDRSTLIKKIVKE